MDQKTVLSSGPKDTEALGEALGKKLRNTPTLIFLEGPMGSGKTTFVRGFARGMNVDPRMVQSPTFTLIHDYGAFLHVDLYRMLDLPLHELMVSGLMDALDESRTTLVEWIHPELEKQIPPDVRITFSWGKDDTYRRIELYGIIP